MSDCAFILPLDVPQLIFNVQCVSINWRGNHSLLIQLSQIDLVEQLRLGTFIPQLLLPQFFSQICQFSAAFSNFDVTFPEIDIFLNFFDLRGCDFKLRL